MLSVLVFHRQLSGCQYPPGLSTSPHTAFSVCVISSFTNKNMGPLRRGRGGGLNFNLLENYLLVGKFSTKFRAKNYNSGELRGKIGILSNHNLLCRKFAAVCRKNATSRSSYRTTSPLILVHTLWVKKGTSILLPITLADVDGFSKFFHCCIHQEICNKPTVTLSTTP